MMGIVKTSIRRPVFAVMIIAALVGLGWISIGRGLLPEKWSII